MSDFTTRVYALNGQGAEDRRPICNPGFVAFEVRFCDEVGDAEGEEVD